MNSNHDFMISEEHRPIFRTKKGVAVKFSYEKGFNSDHIIDKPHLEKISRIESSIEKIDHYPFLVTGESIKCFFSKDLADAIREPGDLDEDLFLMATPVCFYFENFNGWIYTAAKEWNEQIENTGELFPVLKTGSIYKMVKKQISDELGPEHKTELLIPKESMLFNTEEQLLEYHSSKGQNRNGDFFKENVSFTRLEGWDMEFMILAIGKSFSCRTIDYDQIKTTNRGGTRIQAIQIIGIGQEKIGWLPVTVSRIRYGIELVQEP